jgi:hypothetical protein
MKICVWDSSFDACDGILAFAFRAAAYVDFGMLMGELIDSLQAAFIVLVN